MTDDERQAMEYRRIGLGIPASPPLGVSKTLRELAENALTARGSFSVAICAETRLFDAKAIERLESVDAEAETALLTAIAALEAENSRLQAENQRWVPRPTIAGGSATFPLPTGP